MSNEIPVSAVAEGGRILTKPVVRQHLILTTTCLDLTLDSCNHLTLLFLVRTFTTYAGPGSPAINTEVDAL